MVTLISVERIRVCCRLSGMIESVEHGRRIQAGGKKMIHPLLCFDIKKREIKNYNMELLNCYHVVELQGSEQVLNMAIKK